MILTYRYRLLPSRRQHAALETILEAQRELYNAALEERIGAYRKRALKRTYFDQCKALTEWRHEDPEARSLPLNIQRATLKRLDNAFNGFFRRVRSGTTPGFPRFKGKGRFRSFGFRELDGIVLGPSGLRFNGVPGYLRIHLHRPLPNPLEAKSCTFKRDEKGWSISIALAVPSAPTREPVRAVGVDLGILRFAALSDGGFIPSLRAARRAERRLRRAQRSLERKSRGSVGRIKARREVARCHAKIARERDNHLHQASSRLVRDYDVIAIEAIKIKHLARSVVAKDVHDAAWGKFISVLRYKAERAGATVVEVDPRYTSQDCSSCGLRVRKSLADRWHTCRRCGLSIDRDLNAARNILNRAGMGPVLRNAVEDRGVQVESSARVPAVTCS